MNQDPWAPFQLSEMRTLLQNCTAMNTGFSLPSPQLEGISCGERQCISSAHLALSYLLLKLSSRWVWLRNGDSFCLTIIDGMEATVATAPLRIREPWLLFPWLVGWEFCAERGKPRRPGAANFPTTECAASREECHSEKRVPLSPSLAPMTWLRDFCLRGGTGHKTESLKSLPNGLIPFATV